MHINSTYKVCILLKVLEIATTNIYSQYTRYLLMIICFYNLIQASIHLQKEGKESCIYCLFSQGWFIKITKDEKSDQQLPHIQEELISTLILTALYTKQTATDSREQINQVIMDVLDVTYGIINWRIAQRSGSMLQVNPNITFAIDMYLILLEESIHRLDKRQLKIRLLELTKRINQNEMHFLPKLKAIYVICKNYTHQSLELQLDYNAILSDFRHFMIQPVQTSFFSEIFVSQLSSQSEIVKYLDCVELIFECLYYLALKFKNPTSDIKASIMSLVNDFYEHLNTLQKTKGSYQLLVLTTMEFTASVRQVIEKEEVGELETIHINKDFLE